MPLPKPARKRSWVVPKTLWGALYRLAVLMVAAAGLLTGVDQTSAAAQHQKGYLVSTALSLVSCLKDS